MYPLVSVHFLFRLNSVTNTLTTGLSLTKTLQSCIPATLKYFRIYSLSFNVTEIKYLHSKRQILFLYRKYYKDLFFFLHGPLSMFFLERFLQLMSWDPAWSTIATFPDCWLLFWQCNNLSFSCLLLCFVSLSLYFLFVLSFLCSALQENPTQRNRPTFTCDLHLGKNHQNHSMIIFLVSYTTLLYFS